MENKHGNLSINSENIFPIIKKWLYSDHDIFYRELISNGCDAITKLKKLDMMGEYSQTKNSLTRSLFPARLISWKNTKTKQTKIRLSVISALAFILPLWLQTR